MQKQSQVKISHPCPMALSKLKGESGLYNCKSCAKTLVDFRGKTYQEIKSISTPKTCGIFDEHQVKPFTNFGFFRTSAFKMVTIISLMGFNVKPLSANVYKDHLPNRVELVKEEEDKKKKKKRERKAWWNPFKKKKKKFTPVGCPSF